MLQTKSFENKVERGINLASEDERYLTKTIFKKPVIVYNYSKEIKAFYMRLSDDKKAVAAMEVLVPKIFRGKQHLERFITRLTRSTQTMMDRPPLDGLVTP